MEDDSNPNLANINIDEITAALHDNDNDTIIDINSDFNQPGNNNNNHNSNKNNADDVEMKNAAVEEEVDVFLCDMVKRELEVLEQNSHRDPIGKKTFDELNDTISKITMTNHIKRRNLIAKMKMKNKEEKKEAIV